MVAERGDLDGVDELPVPDSLQGLIAARLDSLTRAEKDVLQDAAVLGKVFWPGALITDGRDGSELDEALRTLERKEFVRRERRSSVEDEPQYVFRHVLVRDVAYAQIPRAIRAERHEQVADWIATRVRGEDAAELLAHHYANALEYSRAAGRDSTALHARARLALRDAGRRAVALSAFVNADRFFKAALELTPEDDPEWPRLVLDHAEAAIYVDISNDRLLFRARPLLAGDVDDAARAEMLLGEYRWLRGDQNGAGEHFRAAEPFAEAMTDEGSKLQVLANLARFAMLADESERAETLAREALALAEKRGRDDLRAARVEHHRRRACTGGRPGRPRRPRGQSRDRAGHGRSRVHPHLREPRLRLDVARPASPFGRVAFRGARNRPRNRLRGADAMALDGDRDRSHACR